MNAEALRLFNEMLIACSPETMECGNFHHSRIDRHDGGTLCPVLDRYRESAKRLRALLSASDDVPEGRRIAIARDEFFASLSGATLAGAPTGVALRNRLELAFVEGWKAAKLDASPTPPDEWRTMESAPRDGTTILAACQCVGAGNDDRFFVTEVQWKLFDEFTLGEEMAWVMVERDDIYKVLPSAWMPMPEFFGFTPSEKTK